MIQRILANRRSYAEIVYEILSAAREGVTKDTRPRQSRVTDRQASRYIVSLRRSQYREGMPHGGYRLTLKRQATLAMLGGALHVLRNLMAVEDEPPEEQTEEKS